MHATALIDLSIHGPSIKKEKCDIYSLYLYFHEIYSMDREDPPATSEDTNLRRRGMTDAGHPPVRQSPLLNRLGLQERRPVPAHTPKGTRVIREHEAIIAVRLRGVFPDQH
jgi:hypothetical protein